MKQFILDFSYIIEDDLETNLTLRPSDLEISDYLATSVSYENIAIASAAKDELIVIMTPKLFEVFQQMENIPLEIRNNYYIL